MDDAMKKEMPQINSPASKTSRFTEIATYLVAILIGIKLLSILIFSRQLFHPQSGVVPLDQRLPAVLNTLLLNFDMQAMAFMFFVIVLPTLLQLAADSESFYLNPYPYRNHLFARCGVEPVVHRHVRSVFRQSLLICCFYYLLDFLLSLTFHPLRSFGVFYNKNEVFLYNPLVDAQRNWATLSMAPEVYYALFAIQASLLQSLLAAFTVLLTYRWKMDIRLKIAIPFMIIFVASTAGAVLEKVLQNLFPAREIAVPHLGKLLLLYSGRRSFLPLFNLSMLIHLLLFIGLGYVLKRKIVHEGVVA